MRCLDESAGYDMIDLSNSATLELLMRKTQLVEFAHHMDYFPSRTADKGKDKYHAASLQHAAVDEAAIFSGVTKGSGTVMVCLDLITHVASEVERDAAILKQVRKAREE
eukprot:8076625-Pyramimonas_sp.AAC.1